MFRPNLIANYFIKKSLDSGDLLTPMKLLKLVYIAHGWHLSLSNGRELINEAVQAWKYGPVVRSVYHKFKGYGNERIVQLAKYDVNPFTYDPLDQSIELDELDSIPDDTKTFLDKIWKVYSPFTGVQLSEMTHKPGTPWWRTWHDEHGKEIMDAIIPNDVIKSHYDELAGHGKEA